jgi:hypothetical protein
MQTSQGLCHPNPALLQVSLRALLTYASCDVTPKKSFPHRAHDVKPDLCNVSSILVSDERQPGSRSIVCYILPGERFS